MMIDESTNEILLWVALGGYTLVILFVLPLVILRDFNGYNSIVIGILIFTVLVGIAIANSLFLHLTGLGAIVLNLAWITLLYQTGVIAEWWKTLRKRRQI